MRYEKVPISKGQRPARIYEETGEVKEYISKDGGNFNNTKLFFNSPFQKSYTKNWNRLDLELSEREFLFVNRLSRLAQPFTNSLKPFNDKTTATELSEILNVDRRYIKKMVKKLRELKIIDTYKVEEAIHDIQKNIDRYWVFNPYISFNGSVINKDIVEMFKNSKYARN